MRAIVTGGAGFIGSHLVDRLRVNGWSVRVIDEAIGERIASTSAPTEADVIYHLASRVGPVGVLAWRGMLALDTISNAAIVADWARWCDCPLVFTSTSEVYGANGVRATEATPAVFAAEPSARKEYAVAKLAAETMLRNTVGLDVRIVRPFNVAGPRQRTDGGFVLPRFLEQATAGTPLTVYQPGTQRRAFTHVADIVDGLILAYERGNRGGVYNLGNPANSCTIRELAEEVIEVTGSSSPVTIIDPKDLWGPAFREAPDKYPDLDAAIHELGWQPTRNRRQTIEDAWSAVRAPTRP